MLALANRPVIAIKKRPLSSPWLGRLQPLVYADGTPIIDVKDEFPSTGDIFVTTGYDTIPNDLLEVQYEYNTSAATSHDPSFSHYVVNDPRHWRPASGERFCDLIETDNFVSIDGGVMDQSLNYIPGTYFFIFNRLTNTIRGPFKHRVSDMDYHSGLGSYDFKTDRISGNEQIVQRFPYVKYGYLVELDADKIGDALIAPSLLESNMDYDYRSLVDLNELSKYVDDDVWIDAFSGQEVMVWITSRIRQEFEMSRSEYRKVRNMLFDLSRDDLDIPKHLFEERIEKAISQFDLADEHQDLIENMRLEVLQDFMKSESEERLKIIKEHIKNHPVLLDRLKHELGESAEKERHETARQLKRQEEQHAAELEELKEDYARRLEELRKAGEATIQNERMAARYEELQQKIELLEKEKDQLDNYYTVKQQDVEKLDEKLRAKESALRRKILEHRLTADMLSIIPKKPSKFASEMFQVHVSAASEENGKLDMSAVEWLQEVQKFFEECGRPISFGELAWYTTAITQGWMTLFVGHPGVGKTSTVELLAESLGLWRSESGSGEKGLRFLKVNVGRGWVSSRDLVGIYNPLNQEFEPSDTGLYYALKQLTAENQNKRHTFPFWILLDELNLSPVEHYLSDFLAEADKHRYRVVFGGEQFSLDSKLRFIGTVNYDETTENLSPRLISRSNIIYMHPPDLRNIELDSGQPRPPIGPISMKTLNELTQVTPELEDREHSIFASLQETLQSDDPGLGRPTLLTPRTVNSVAAFCQAAREWMGEDFGELGALDAAIAQRVLPMCTGSGNYGRRLEKVQDIFKSYGLSRSSRISRRMLEYGSDFEEYDFFNF